MKVDDREARTVVGRRERVALPEWGINRIRGKIDTGARTCSLDVDNLVRQPDEHVEFDVVLSRDRQRVRRIRARLKRKSHVRPSTGETQTRHVVETLLRIGAVERRVEINLVPRDGMICRMLIGRNALRGRFLVDPDAKYLTDEGCPPEGE